MNPFGKLLQIKTEPYFQKKSDTEEIIEHYIFFPF